MTLQKTTSASTTWRLKSYAKINLGLEVLGRRPDGYHELTSVMQAISLHDILTVAESVDITVDGDIPSDRKDTDLVRRAAELLRDFIGGPYGARLTLHKRIPIASGLGGGSSNAACTLLGLNRFWEANLSIDQLVPMAVELGADVAFFLHGGTALATGRGDQTMPLPNPPVHNVVIAMPHRSLSTALVYANLSHAQFSDGTSTRRVAHNLSGDRLEYSDMCNALEVSATRLCPEIREIRSHLQSSGAKSSIVSGSGSACFGLFSDREIARTAATKLSAAGFWCTQCRFVGPWNGHPTLDYS